MIKFIKNSLIMIYDYFWDLRLGIRTGGIYPSDTPGIFNDNAECNPTNYKILNKVFRSLDIKDNDVLVDYGCGKGRVICFGSQFLFKKIYGIEISEKWARIARSNVNKKQLNNVYILNIDAIDFDSSDCTVYYFFNPFGEKTLQYVIKNIARTLENNNRHIKIIYYNAKYKDVIEKENFLRHTKTLYFDRKGNEAVLLYENIQYNNLAPN